MDILEVFQVHPALSPERDLTHIVLETAQAGKAALVHDRAVAQQAGLSPTDQPSFADHAASHQPDARDGEDLTDLSTTQRLLPVGRLKQAFQRGPDVLDDFVDDIVEADLDAFPLGQLHGLAFGTDREANNDTSRRGSKKHIRL